MSKRTVVLAIAAVMFLGAALFAQSDEKKSEVKRTDQKGVSLNPADPGYVIGPEDVLRVDVWKEPELSGNVPVRPDGKISLNLLGDVDAAGLTPEQLATETTKLFKKYLEDPRVTVTVVTVNSRRVFILGEVGRPGAFPLLPEMTVLQALSTAGGLSPYASANKIYILRHENGKQTKLAFQYKRVIKGENPEQNIVLQPGDTIVVP